MAGEMVTTTGACETVIWKDWVPDCDSRSSAEIVKVKVPTLLGVPEMTPGPLRRMPGGNCPEATAK